MAATVAVLVNAADATSAIVPGIARFAAVTAATVVTVVTVVTVPLVIVTAGVPCTTTGAAPATSALGRGRFSTRVR
jgi:hypothetical protein